MTVGRLGLPPWIEDRKHSEGILFQHSIATEKSTTDLTCTNVKGDSKVPAGLSILTVLRYKSGTVQVPVFGGPEVKDRKDDLQGAGFRNDMKRKAKFGQVGGYFMESSGVARVPNTDWRSFVTLKTGVDGLSGRWTALNLERLGRDKPISIAGYRTASPPPSVSLQTSPRFRTEKGAFTTLSSSPCSSQGTVVYP